MKTIFLPDDGEEIVQAFEKVNEKEAFNAINAMRQHFDGQFNFEDFLQNLTDMESVSMKNSKTNLEQASKTYSNGINKY